MTPPKKLPRGIRKLGPDLWEINVSLGIDPAKTQKAGQPVYRREYKRVRGTLTDAKQARARMEVEGRQGRYGGTDATVDDLLDAWLRELERVGRAPKTIASYRNYAAQHIRPIFGPLKVRTITARMLADHLAALSEQGYEPNTVRLVHATLSSAFSQAARWEWVEKDPTKLVQAPSIRNKRPVIPTVEEVAALLDAAAHHRLGEAIVTVIWLAATTGARRGELCGLQVRDFDFTRGRMQIERAISEREVWTTKNRRWREVALDPVTIEVVQRHIALLEQRAHEADTQLGPESFVFSDTPGGSKPWNPHIVTDAFADLKAKLNLPHLTFHTLRKFMESRALDAGFSVAEVAHRGGHDPSVLLRFYAGGVDESGVRLAEAVASLLPAPGQ